MIFIDNQCVFKKYRHDCLPNYCVYFLFYYTLLLNIVATVFNTFTLASVGNSIVTVDIFEFHDIFW